MGGGADVSTLSLGLVWGRAGVREKLYCLGDLLPAALHSTGAQRMLAGDDGGQGRGEGSWDADHSRILPCSEWKT